jgi:hypothetical protein
MFCDAAQSTAGIVILGEAIRRTPELNKPELYSDVNLGPEVNDTWANYEIETVAIWTGHVSKMVESLDTIVEQVINVLTDAVEKATIVAGTLRMRVVNVAPVMGANSGSVTLELLWIQEKPKDE